MDDVTMHAHAVDMQFRPDSTTGMMDNVTEYACIDKVHGVMSMHITPSALSMHAYAVNMKLRLDIELQVCDGGRVNASTCC